MMALAIREMAMPTQEADVAQMVRAAEASAIEAQRIAVETYRRRAVHLAEAAMEEAAARILDRNDARSRLGPLG